MEDTAFINDIFFEFSLEKLLDNKLFQEKSEKLSLINDWEGSRPHARRVSAERSEISKRVEYLQNTIFRSDRNFQHITL